VGQLIVAELHEALDALNWIFGVDGSGRYLGATLPACHGDNQDRPALHQLGIMDNAEINEFGWHLVQQRDDGTDIGLKLRSDSMVVDITGPRPKQSINACSNFAWKNPHALPLQLLHPTPCTRRLS
jgi:hypothetical protein